ncbi:MAG TPA: serine/threonine-protein kinase, partial [Vicinamibacterales bacterium]|nr:serine/threonine-protein kinase [Vicinamibacterales bacterium]
MLASGTRLGPYEVIAPLGAGGMGEVYRARDTKLDRPVAIKVLPESFGDDPDRLTRFEREARAVAALSHPNILSIYDFGTHEGVAFAVMELLEGETLRARLAEGCLPARKAVEISLQIAGGLAAAHEKGVVHRDLKPENVFVTRDGRVKILDFGLAKVVAAADGGPSDRRAGLLSPEMATVTGPAKLTAAGVVMGTVGYMAPEQVRGQAVDHRADLFAFGAILYEALTGTRAFKGDSAVETMNAILKEDPPDYGAMSGPVPPVLDRIVRRCLEKNPDERFQSARDLA